MATKYFIGQGRLLIAELGANDAPGGFTEVANVPELSYSFATDRYEHRESYSGQRLKDVSISRNPDGGISFMVDEVLDKDTMALALRGVVTATAAGSVTDEPVTAVHDKWVALQRISLNASPAPVVTNTAGAITYVSGTDYEINMSAGMIRVKSTGTITSGQALKIDYSAEAQNKASAFTNPGKLYWLRLNGLNELDSLRPVVIDAYKCELSPGEGFAGISEDMAKFSINGVMLASSFFPAASTIEGRFFRILYL